MLFFSIYALYVYFHFGKINQQSVIGIKREKQDELSLIKDNIKTQRRQKDIKTGISLPKQIYLLLFLQMIS